MTHLSTEDVPNYQLMQIIESYHLGRCYACGWSLSPNREAGCVPGDCAFRPSERDSQYQGWHTRMEILGRVAAVTRRRNGG